MVVRLHLQSLIDNMSKGNGVFMKILQKFIGICLLLSLFLAVCACADETQEDLYLDFSGDLDYIPINYAKREDEMQVQYWWDRARLETTDHFMLITSVASRSTLSQNQYKNMFYSDGETELSFDKMFVENMYFDDAAFDYAVKIALSDYDYKEVYLNLARPEGLSDEDFELALINAASSIRKYAPYCRIAYVSARSSDKELFARLNIDQSYELNTLEEAIEAMQNCTHVISAGTHENPAKCRETQKWINIGFVNANMAKEQKRVLLIGDSISQGYYPFVKELLPDYAIDFYQTSKGLDDSGLYSELEFIFSQYDYDLIHFNIGLHLHTVTTETYGDYLDGLCTKLSTYEKNAKLMFATTTPAGYPYSDANNGSILSLNATAKNICAQKNIPIDDLFQLVKEKNLTKLSETDTLHFSQESYKILADQVAVSIKENIQ